MINLWAGFQQYLRKKKKLAREKRVQAFFAKRRVDGDKISKLIELTHQDMITTHPPVELTFENVIEEFIDTFPEFREQARLELESSPDMLLPYVFIANIVNSFLSMELAKDIRNEPLLNRVFSFFERMATSPDKRVYELLGTGITEVLGDDATRLRRARMYMGPSTRKNSDEMEKYWGRLQNLES